MWPPAKSLYETAKIHIFLKRNIALYIIKIRMPQEGNFIGTLPSVFVQANELRSEQGTFTSWFCPDPFCTVHSLVLSVFLKLENKQK